jgi:UDP-perosamine 4-acetyltransferase
MIKVVGFGAGGHAGVMLDILKLQRTYRPIGLLEADPDLCEKEAYDLPVLHEDNAEDLLSKGIKYAFLGVGSQKSTLRRIRIFEKFRAMGFEFINVIDPRADIAVSATIGEGVTVMQGAIVQAHSQVGENVVINTGSIVEHDCVVDDHAHIATGAMLAGNVIVESGVHVGIGAVIREGIRLGKNAVIGAGAVVVKDVRAGTTVAGVPAVEMEMPESF